MQTYVMLKDRGGNCLGEHVRIDDESAARMLAAGIIGRLDSAGHIVQPPAVVQETAPTADQQQESTTTEQTAPSASHVKTGVELWEFDRWPKPVAEGLVAGGIHTVEQLQAFVASGKKLEDLKGIGKKTESDLIEMYCSE